MLAIPSVYVWSVVSVESHLDSICSSSKETDTWRCVEHLDKLRLHVITARRGRWCGCINGLSDHVVPPRRIFVLVIILPGLGLGLGSPYLCKWRALWPEPESDKSMVREWCFVRRVNAACWCRSAISKLPRCKRGLHVPHRVAILHGDQSSGGKCYWSFHPILLLWQHSSGLSGLKWAKTGGVVSWDFNVRMVSEHAAVQFHDSSFFSNWRSGVVVWDYWGRKKRAVITGNKAAWRQKWVLGFGELPQYLTKDGRWAKMSQCLYPSDVKGSTHLATQCMS